MYIPLTAAMLYGLIIVIKYLVREAHNKQNHNKQNHKNR
jgi:hypothetical protein